MQIDASIPSAHRNDSDLFRGDCRKNALLTLFASVILACVCWDPTVHLNVEYKADSLQIDLFKHPQHRTDGPVPSISSGGMRIHMRWILTLKMHSFDWLFFVFVMYFNDKHASNYIHICSIDSFLALSQTLKLPRPTNDSVSCMHSSSHPHGINFCDYHVQHIWLLSSVSDPFKFAD